MDDRLAPAPVAEFVVAVNGNLGGPRIEFEGVVSEPDPIPQGESDRLATESRDARSLDQQLAEEMRHRRLGGETSSAGYLRELGDRPRLPSSVERRLVEAARAGARRARG